MPFISKKRLEQLERLEQSSRELIELTEKNNKRAFLIGIERSGRKLLLTFVRQGEPYQIEAMSMLSDNIPEWKDKLLR